MNILLLVTVVISIILSLIILKNYSISKKIIICIAIQGCVLLVIAPIITFLAMLIGSSVEILILTSPKEYVPLEVIFILGYTIFIYATPFYAFYINKSKKKNGKLYPKILYVTFIFFLIIVLVYLFISLNINNLTINNIVFQIYNDMTIKY